MIVIPDLSLREVQDGMTDAQVPPPYAGGLGAEGLAALKQFAQEGGHLVLVDGATELAPAALGIDVKLVTAGGGGGGRTRRRMRSRSMRRGRSCGCWSTQPTRSGRGWRIRRRIYFVNSTSLELPAGSPARVIARYPAQPESILLSGFLQGPAKLAGKVAAADMRVRRRAGDDVRVPAALSRAVVRDVQDVLQRAAGAVRARTRPMRPPCR